jgi:Pregnancy-associated plasma protein-A
MKNILILLLVLVATYTKAQEIITKQNGCGTRTPKNARVISKDDMGRFLSSPSAISVPYSVKVYITVFADNDGSNRAATDANVLIKFQQMVNQYNNHGICFVLAGIRQINNSDLNIQDTDSEESEVYDLRITDCLNIFIHKQFIKPNLIGTAYEVLNNNAFVSLLGSAIDSPNFTTLMAHEVGHVFGLYHTFEIHPGDPFHGYESVARTGDCADCDVDGDLLCDTPADPNDSDGYLANNTDASCIYTGTKLDECNVLYMPAVNNIMTYGRDACKTIFTAGQGERMRYFIGTESGLQSVLAQNTSGIFFPITISSGISYGVARDLYTIQPASGSVIFNGTSNYTFQAKRVVLGAGTRLSPSVGGKIHIKENPYCN